MRRPICVLTLCVVSLFFVGCPKDGDFEQNGSGSDASTSADTGSMTPDDMGSTTPDDTGSTMPDDMGPLDAMHTGDTGGLPDSGSPDGGRIDMGTCETGCPDGVCDTSSNICVECLMADDCPDVPNSMKSCDSSECTYMCAMGFADDPDTGDLCTCTVNDEVCDGTDQNCDGVADNGLDPVLCTDATGIALAGVCTGAAVACTGDNQMAYEDGTCSDAMLEMHAAATGELYLAADDEGWRCDGADNDCDGTPDEACCATGTTPTPRQYGTTRNDDQVTPALAPATTGAPVDAAHLLVWAEEDRVYAQHIDEAGIPKGLEQNFQSRVEEFYSLDVVDTGAGYMLAYAGVEDGTDYRLVLQPLDASGRETGDFVDVVETQTPFIYSAALETNGTEVLLVWSIGDKTAAQWDLQSCVFTPGQQPNPCEQSANHKTLDSNRFTPCHPSIDANANGTFVVGWLAPNPTAPHDLRSNIVDKNGTPGGAIDLMTTSEPDFDRVAVAWQDPTTYHVVAAVAGASSHVLTHIPVTSGIAGTTTDLYDSNRPDRPTAIALDDDGQPGAERLLLAFYEATTSKLVGASLDLANPSMLSVHEIATSSPPKSAVFPLALGPRSVGVAWQDRGTNPERINYTPLSLDGPPICTPSP